MRDSLSELLEEAGVDPEPILAWMRRHRGALLLGAALLAALLLLVPTPAEAPDKSHADLAPDETPLFV